MDYRETIAQALVREVAEETGLRVEPGRLLFVNDTIDPSGPRHVINLTFAADITGGSIIDEPLDPRVAAIDLVDIADLESLDLRPPIASELAAVLRGESGDAHQCYIGPVFKPADTL